MSNKRRKSKRFTFCCQSLLPPPSFEISQCSTISGFDFGYSVMFVNIILPFVLAQRKLLPKDQSFCFQSSSLSSFYEISQIFSHIRLRFWIYSCSGNLFLLIFYLKRISAILWRGSSIFVKSVGVDTISKYELCCSMMVNYTAAMMLSHSATPMRWTTRFMEWHTAVISKCL